MEANVCGADCFAPSVAQRHGDRAQADLEFLVDERVVGGAHAIENGDQFAEFRTVAGVNLRRCELTSSARASAGGSADNSARPIELQ